MRMRRLKVEGERAVYHCMSRTVNKEALFGYGDLEVLRAMVWRTADFSGVKVLTYCLLDNHFHVLVEVPERGEVDDVELMRRYRVLYPRPTKYQEATARELERVLGEGGAEAAAIRRRLLSRMGDVSEYMKTLKQRFSMWYNARHGRCGTLWSERFKSVLVEGSGSALQTMAAYIDLNAVRRGLVDDPKDYRYCGYAEAVAGRREAVEGLRGVWADYADGTRRGGISPREALRSHRLLIFGKGSSPWTGRGRMVARRAALRVLEKEQGLLPKAAVLRCRVRYFSDGVALGTADFVGSVAGLWQSGRKFPPEVTPLRGARWGDLAVLRTLRRRIFE